MYKIIIVGSVYPFRGGGLSTYNERLAKELLSHGHAIKCYTFSLQYPALFFPGKTQYSTDPPPEDLDIEPIVNTINPLNWVKTGRRIKKERPDLLIMRYWIPFVAPCLGTIARIVRNNGHTKVIVIVDNIVPHEKRIADKILSKYFVKSCDAFIAMSKNVLSDLQLFDNKKPKQYCPHPLYDNFGKAIEKKSAKQVLGLEEDIHYILFFGFIRSYKGLDILIKAFADDRLRKYRLKLIIAGEYYENADPYLELIKKNDLDKDIIQSNNFIPNGDVVKYFCASDLVVQPYKSATQSGVTQIAYHFDKPMIVTNVGGLPEMIPDQKVGYVVEPVPLAIANAIIDFYEQKKEAFFVSNVKKEKKKYSWKLMVEKIVDLYKGLS